jgi:hypothetical protein
MQDFPDDWLCEFRNCGPRGNALVEYRRSVAFRIWLAARRQSDPENVPASYRLLAATNMFEIRFGSYFDRTDQGVRPRVVDAEEFTINWTDATRSTVRPVVSGQTANELLGDRLNRLGVGRRP